MTPQYPLTTNGTQTPDLGAPQDKDGGVCIQITGTWTGTLEFQASVDGTNFIPISAQPLGGGAAVTTVTANGIWRVPASTIVGLGGINRVRVGATAAMTGTALIQSQPFDIG